MCSSDELKKESHIFISKVGLWLRPWKHLTISEFACIWDFLSKFYFFLLFFFKQKLWLGPVVLWIIHYAGIACWLDSWTHDQKVAISNLGRNDRRIFFSRVNFVHWLFIWCALHLRFTAVACKRSQSFCQKSRWQVRPQHAYTLWPNEPLSRQLTRNLAGKTGPQSSQLAESLWTNPGINSGISVRKRFRLKVCKQRHFPAISWSTDMTAPQDQS